MIDIVDPDEEYNVAMYQKMQTHVFVMRQIGADCLF